LWNDNLKENPTDGNLKEELVTGNWKDTCVFQKELNKRSLAVMSDDMRYAKDDIFIREQFRGRGIGMWALKQLFKHETLRVSYVSTQGNASMLSLQLRSEVCLREPWATRVSQHENDRDAVEAANQGIQLFFRKVNCSPPQRLTSNC
jgi:predicted acetyltransferase